MKIAVIGSGISGLTAAHLLSSEHEVSVFEAGERIGGHTATVDVALAGRPYAIDTGFIVYNDRSYPNFIRLLDELGVQNQPTEMSFSVSCEATGLEYAGSNLNTLFAQRRNLVRPWYWRMLRDIVRFNRETVQDLQSGKLSAGMTLGNYLQENGYSNQFASHYLVPMGAAIWSSGSDEMLDFPLEFFVRFFRNHGLLDLANRPQWRVIKGGSRNYLGPLTARYADRIFTSTPIQSIERSEEAVSLKCANGSQHSFDQVVVATHSDQAMKLLADPSHEELSVLSKMGYAPNSVVLHTDTSLLPRRQLAWSSWNSRLTGKSQPRAQLTYNMNILQGIDAPETFCVSLNSRHLIDPERILGEFSYSHPVFTLDSIASQQRWQEINGTRRTWFCGAYWANGFHEDGVNSARRVANALGVSW